MTSKPVKKDNIDRQAFDIGNSGAIEFLFLIATEFRIEDS